MASAMIGNLAVSLTMNTAAFQRGATLAEKRTQQMRGSFAAATTSVKGFGQALGVGIGADILYRITASAFEMASSLSEAAERAGVTVEALQELRFAAEQTGVGAEALEGLLQKLGRSMGQAANGSKAILTALDQLGLSFEDLQGKAVDEQFRIVADAISKASDQQAALAAGTVLMGRSFADALPLVNGGREALEQYGEVARENGVITTEEAKRLDELADSWERLKVRVGVAVAKIMAAVADMVDPIVAAFESIGIKVNIFDLTFVGLTKHIIDGVTEMVLAIGRWIRDTLGKIWDDAITKIRTVGAVFEWLYDKVIGNSWVPDLVDGIEAEFSRLGEIMAQPAEAVAVRVEQTFKDMADGVLSSFSRLTSAIKGGGFLSILEAVIGLGLQLGSTGLFGGTIQGRLNGTTGGYVSPPRNSGTNITVTPSPYFDVVVDTRIGNAAPQIARAGGAAGVAMIAYGNSRRVG